jgi:hypothetical protein
MRVFATSSLSLSPRMRFAHWLTTAALASLIGGGLVGGAVLMAPSLFAAGGAEPQPDVVAFFGVTALAGAWLLALALKATEDRAGGADGQRDEGLRRFALLAAGLCTGAVAWGVCEFLQLDAGQVFAGQKLDGAFGYLGERPLTQSVNGRASPTALGYLVFFGGVFALRSWWRQVDLARESRFRVGAVLMSLLVAWLWSALLAFPQTWGLLWIAVISSTVQLAAPWSPRPRVHRLARKG